jgi:hypothetical protein
MAKKTPAAATLDVAQMDDATIQQLEAQLSQLRGVKRAQSLTITRERFLAEAEPIEVTINGVPFVATVKEFSSGSLGWYLTGKMAIGGQSVQIGLNLTVIGSKELPR